MLRWSLFRLQTRATWNENFLINYLSKKFWHSDFQLPGEFLISFSNFFLFNAIGHCNIATFNLRQNNTTRNASKLFPYSQKNVELTFSSVNRICRVRIIVSNCNKRLFITFHHCIFHLERNPFRYCNIPWAIHFSKENYFH